MAAAGCTAAKAAAWPPHSKAGGTPPLQGASLTTAALLRSASARTGRVNLPTARPAVSNKTKKENEMQSRSRAVVCLIVFLTAAAVMAQPQIKLPRVSPKASLTQTIGLTDVTITYSRPSVKGRAIWGELVPYGKVWRTGANEATTIKFSDDVMINGQKLPAGTYSLHTIPDKDQWTVIFNNVADQWGSFNYDQTKDALRVTVKPETAPFTESMTFGVDNVTPDSGTVVLRWEKVAVPFTVSVNTTQKALANVRDAVSQAKADDWKTPMRAAQFAFDNKVAQDDASRWLDQSLKLNENINNLYLKAQMQARAGQRDAAVKTAQQAIAKATDKDKEEVVEIQKSIEMWKAGKM
jgi:Protein of unknown function (DUF2911)